MQFKEDDSWHLSTYSPIPDAVDGTPLGNGDMGALLWAQQLCINVGLAKSNLWDTRLRGSATEKSFFPAKDFATIEKQVAAGQFEAMYKEFHRRAATNQSRFTLIAAGLLQILPKENEIELAGWRQSLNMAEGTCELEYETGLRKSKYSLCVSSEYDVLAIRVQCSTKQLPWKVDFALSPRDTANELRVDYLMDQKGKSIFCHIRGYEDLDYWIGLKVTGPGISVHKEGLKAYLSISSKQAKNSAEAYCAIASNLDGPDPLGIVKVRIEKATGDGFASIIRKHKKWWSKFWGASTVSIPDGPVQREHNFGLYLLGSCSRKGCQAPGLQGLWPINASGTGWNDYTNDFNSQAYFWPAFTANHLELVHSYTETFANMLGQVCRDTKKYYKMRGAAYPLCSSPEGHATAGYVTHYHGAALSAFIAENFWWMWRYSQDAEFLRRQAYPVMKQCGLFYLDRCRIDRRTGRAVINASASPEAGEGSYQAWGSNATFDIALIRELLAGLVRSCEILGCDSELKAQWQDLLERLPGYPVADGHLIELAHHEFKDSHRHGSVLAPIYPCGDITNLSSRADQKVGRESFADFLSRGRWLWEGYTYPWLALVAARLGMGNEALKLLEEFIGVGCLRRGGLHLNDDFTGSGLSANGRKNFTLEGNTMYSAAVLEMLVQSHNGIIQIFPAVPDVWQNVSFGSLRCEGAFLVWAQRKNGKTASVHMKSGIGGLCRMRNPYKGKTPYVVSRHSVPTVYKKELISFETKPNESYMIKFH